MATATHLLTEKEATAGPAAEAVVVRFAGDSGDGMQLTGGQFTLSTALAGNDLATFPDFPAEIRAPQGTTFGVSAFQINFGSTAIDTAGDQPDVLVAMNPAALKTNVDALREGGLVIADEGEFTARNLAKAGYEQSPLEDGSLSKWQVVHFNISQLTLDAVKPFGLGNKEALRCKNMWTLGLALWMFDRDRKPIVDWLVARPEVDAERIGLSGTSFGTFFGTILTAHEPRIKACAVTSVCHEPAGETIFQQASPTFKKRFMYMSGITDENEFDEFRKTITWEGHTEKVRVPYLCLAGEFDELSPVEHSVRLIKSVKGPKQMVVYQDSRHSVGNVPAANLGPFPPVLVADWLADRLAGKPFASEHWFVRANGQIDKTSL